MRRSSENDAVERRVPRRGAKILLGALVALALSVFVLEAWSIDADTPVKLGTVRFDAGAFCDEGYKTLDARNRVLFGEAHWTPEDQYAGWSEKSPVTVWLNTLVFDNFGVRLRNARILSLGFALGSAALLFWLLEERFGAVLAALGVLLLAVHPLFAVYGRLALFEVKVLFFSLLGLIALTTERPWPTWRRLSVAGVAFLLAYGSKETALFGIASLILGWILMRASESLRGGGARRAVTWSLFLAGVLVLAVLEGLGIAVQLRGRGLTSLVEFGRELFTLDVLRSNPVLTLLGGVASILVLRRLITRAPAPRSADVLMLCWFWTQTLAFTCFAYRPSRYYLVALPGLVWLALLALREAEQAYEEFIERPAGVASILLGLVMSVGLWHLATSIASFTGLMHPRNVESKQIFLERFGGLLLVTWPLCVAAILFLGRALTSRARALWAARAALGLATALNAGMFAVWMGAPRYELVAGVEEMRKLPPDSVLVGDWAPQLALDTELRAIYLTWDNLHRLRRIKPTHVVVMRRANPRHREQLDQLFPGALSTEPELRFPYANDTAEIYRFSLLW